MFTKTKQRSNSSAANYSRTFLFWSTRHVTTMCQHYWPKLEDDVTLQLKLKPRSHPAVQNTKNKSLRIENPGNTSISAGVETLGHSAAFSDNVTLKIHIYREQIEIGNDL